MEHLLHRLYGVDAPATKGKLRRSSLTQHDRYTSMYACFRLSKQIMSVHKRFFIEFRSKTNS